MTERKPSMDEAEAVAGLEPQMEHFGEIVRSEAKRQHHEGLREKRRRDEEWDRERRARERNFERMVLPGAGR